jgi:hypothetical protein
MSTYKENRLTHDDRELLKWAIRCYRRAERRDFYKCRVWGNEEERAAYVRRYPILGEWLYPWGKHSVWRSSAGVTVILRDDERKLVASYSANPEDWITHPIRRIH